MAISQKVSVTTDRKTIAPVVYAVQGDTGRQIVAEYSDFQLAAGMTGVFAFTRSDGTSYSVPATIDVTANTATAEMDQALTQTGKTKGQIKITDSSGLGSTFTFYIDVQEDLSGTPTEQQYYDIQAAVEAAAEAKAEADQVLEDLGPISQINDRLTEAEEELDNKADIDGTYPSLTAGLAEQLLSSNRVTDQTPYLYRQTALGKANATRALMKKIVGGSVIWNQLAKALVDSNYNKGLGTAVYDNGTVSFTAAARYGALYSKTIKELVEYHKYLISAKIKMTGQLSAYTVRLGIGNMGYDQGAIYVPSTESVTSFTKISGVVQYSYGTNPTYNYLFLQDNRAEVSQIDMKDLMLIDLTAMFGTTIADYIYGLETATAGSGIAKLREWGFFGEDYYAYDAGTMKSVEGVSAKETVGFNLWDEEWESGAINGTNGGIYADSSRIRSKNYISVFPNTVYYIKAPSSFNYSWYNENKQYISGDNSASPNYVRRSPNGTRYLKFSINSTTYNHDICINISDPTKNGTYEPYEKHIYPLDSSLTLRGIPKLVDNELVYDGDEYAADGTVTRNTILRAYQSGDESLANAITDGTNTVVYSANASTETAEPYTEVQVVDKDGTEQFVTTGIVPVGHVTEYPENLVGKLDSIPNPPTAAGRYVLQATVASGKVTYAWAAE